MYYYLLFRSQIKKNIWDYRIWNLKPKQHPVIARKLVGFLGENQNRLVPVFRPNQVLKTLVGATYILHQFFCNYSSLLYTVDDANFCRSTYIKDPEYMIQINSFASFLSRRAWHMESSISPFMELLFMTHISFISCVRNLNIFLYTSSQSFKIDQLAEW